jgi:hypothetical protein
MVWVGMNCQEMGTQGHGETKSNFSKSHNKQKVEPRSPGDPLYEFGR